MARTLDSGLWTLWTLDWRLQATMLRVALALAVTCSASSLPRGGGACANDFDCSYGGVCESRKCVCDPQFTASKCNVLRLRPAKLDNGVGSGPERLRTWGGHGIKDNKTGKWVGFFSYMAAGCDLSTWQGNSMIISAVADAPDGPYSQRLTPVVAPWSHNAMIAQHPNGSYFLFHIGSGVAVKPLKNCSQQPDPLFPFPSEPEPATTHVSESLEGPWRAAAGVPAVNNPAVFFYSNGTTLIYDRTSVRWAASIDGPWQPENQRPTVVQAGNMLPEDPFVWRDRRGRFHMLFNANSYHKYCAAGVPCGGHAWSADGLEWSTPVIPAFGTVVPYKGYPTQTYDYVERPQIAQDQAGNPLVFFFGHGYSNISNMAMMFCQEGDPDDACVTTTGDKTPEPPNAPTPAPSPRPPAQCKIFEDTDFNGNDLKSVYTTSSAGCCDECASVEKCSFWTFIPPSTCFLKTSDAGKRPTPGSASRPYTSGCKDMACASRGNATQHA